jgi:hypothetical protein
MTLREQLALKEAELAEAEEVNAQLADRLASISGLASLEEDEEEETEALEEDDEAEEEEFLLKTKNGRKVRVTVRA